MSDRKKQLKLGAFLMSSAHHDWLTIAIAILSTVAVFRFKVNSAWLVLVGGVVGVISQLL